MFPSSGTKVSTRLCSLVVLSESQRVDHSSPRDALKSVDPNNLRPRDDTSSPWRSPVPPYDSTDGFRPETPESDRGLRSRRPGPLLDF